MKIPVYYPSSERKVEVAVLSRFKKLDEKPQTEIKLSNDDGFDEVRDLDYRAIKNDEVENPFMDDRSV